MYFIHLIAHENHHLVYYNWMMWLDIISYSLTPIIMAYYIAKNPSLTKDGYFPVSCMILMLWSCAPYLVIAAFVVLTLSIPVLFVLGLAKAPLLMIHFQRLITYIKAHFKQSSRGLEEL